MTNTKGQYKGEFGEVAPSEAVNHDPEKSFPKVTEKDVYTGGEFSLELKKANSPAIPEDSKYEAKVREIAEEMAIDHVNKEFWPHTWNGGTFHESQKIAWIERYIPASRIAVKHMADAVCHTVIGKMTLEQIITLLKRRGLVAMNADYDVQKACLTPEAYSKLKSPAQPEESGK